MSLNLAEIFIPSKPRPNVKTQQGSALVLAIFIIVIMTVLGAALTRMMSSSAETIAYEVLGTRAYAAAQSGIQWRLQKLFPLGGGTGSCADLSSPNLSNTVGLEDCEITLLSCDAFTYNDGSTPITHYTVRSTGQCYVEGTESNVMLTSRTIEVEARSL